MLERAVVVAPPGVHARVAAEWLAERRVIVAWWAGSRALILACTVALHWLRAPRGYFGLAVFHHVLGPLTAWDGVWYRRIAEHGYLLVPSHQSDPAFFPFFPVLLKLLGAAGLPLAATGVLLANLLFLGALLAFDALGHELVSGAIARRAVLLLAVFPTTYVCSMVYPESLVLLTFALAGLWAARGHWLLCAAAASVAALSRPEGVLLALPVAACVLSQWHGLETHRRGLAVGAVLAAPATAISFPLYLGWALHDPFAWTKAQLAWGRSFRLDGFYHALTEVAAQLGPQPWAARDVGFCLLTLLLLVAAWRAGAQRGWLALGSLIVLLPLGSGSFESDARFGLLALPAYWGLAWLCSRRGVLLPVTLASATLLAAATLTLPLMFP